MDRLYHTVGAGVFYVSYNWVLLERGESTLMAQDECACAVLIAYRIALKTVVLFGYES